MALGHAHRVRGRVEFPEGRDTGVDAFPALQQLAADALVAHLAVAHNGSRHRNRPLGVVGGFADPPRAFLIAGVARNDRSRLSLESTDAVRVPSPNAVMRQPLGLFADGVAGGDALEAATDSVLHYRDSVSPNQVYGN
jgi:hypothetical protein